MKELNNKFEIKKSKSLSFVIQVIEILKRVKISNSEIFK